MSAGRCGCQRMDSFRFVTFRCAGTTRFQLMQNVLKWTRISHWLLPIVKRLSPPPSSLSTLPSLFFSDALTASTQIEMRPERDLPNGPLGSSSSSNSTFLSRVFFVAPLNGMKVYKLSNSSCRQSVPASCQLPHARCQMPVNFWSSPKLSHDIQMA